PALEGVVMRGLERDRDQRYADATAFIHALARVADTLRASSTQEFSAADVQAALKEPTARMSLPPKTPPTSRPPGSRNDPAPPVVASTAADPDAKTSKTPLRDKPAKPAAAGELSKQER